MKYAVIKINGKQYKVKEGDIFAVDKFEGEKGKKLIFEEVLLFVDNETRHIGQPLVKDVKVTGEILEQFKGDKLRIAKFKAKSRYRRVTGFRPLLTKIKIEKIISK